MKKGILAIGLVVLALLAGCMPALENRYLEVQIYPDGKAPYLGEWTAAVAFSLLSFKINPDGTVLACASTESLGTNRGKVFKENGAINIVFDSGTVYHIMAVTEDDMIVKAYSQKYTFIKNNVPPNCTKHFRQF